MSRVTSYGYDLNGNLVVKGLGNGLEEQRAHDARNRVSTLFSQDGGSDVAGYSYGYDRVGNVRQVTEDYPAGNLGSRTVTNSYDGIYRLVAEEIDTAGAGTVTTEYVYDKGNNRTEKIVGSGTTSYLIGTGGNGAGANQIKTVTHPDSSTTGFTYDGNGNRVERVSGGHTDTYSYDYENRLVGLDYQTGSPVGSYGYGYDYRTRRVTRAEPASAVKVAFSGGVSVMEYPSSASSPEVEYVRGHDIGGGVGGLEYSVRSSAPSYSLYNSRGDVVAKTAQNKSLSWQAAYQAFGEHPVEDGATLDRQKANTKDEDPTGLLNEGFRYRDLETGTFITRDPAGFIDGPNLYTYVRQNPWSKFDPEGLESDKAQYDTFEDAVVPSSLDIQNYDPPAGQKPSSDVEYRSDIWYDEAKKKFGYTKPYGIQSPKIAGKPDPTKSPKNVRFRGVTHNHPGVAGVGGPKFSHKGDSALKDSKGDMGVADSGETPIAVVQPDSTGTPIIKIYTPVTGSSQSASKEMKGVVTEYNPETGKFGPETPVPSSQAGKPTSVGIANGNVIYVYPDGTKQLVPTKQTQAFERQFKHKVSKPKVAH